MPDFETPGRTIHVPPLEALRKTEARLERLREMGLHEVLRPKSRVRMPDKHARCQYMEVFDKLMEDDLPRLLRDLRGTGS